MTGGRTLQPDQGCSSLQEIYVDHIYQNCTKTTILDGQSTTYSYDNHTNAWKYAAAMQGGLTLGWSRINNTLHNNTSYINGSWTNGPGNWGQLTNNYFKSLVQKGWGPEIIVNGSYSSNHWRRFDKGNVSVD